MVKMVVNEETKSPSVSQGGMPMEESKAVSLSKSWSIKSAHVPTFSGGSIAHSQTTKGYNSNSTNKSYNNENNSNYKDNNYNKVPFLILPVDGDLSIVDANRGVKIRSIRYGESNTMADNDDTNPNNMNINNNNDDEDGVDGDAIVSFALSANDDNLITVSRNQMIRHYDLTQDWDPTLPAPVMKVWGRSGHSLPVTKTAFHPSHVFLATASVDGTVRVWDVRGAYVTHVFRPMQGGDGQGMYAVTSITWKNELSQLIIAIGRDDGSIVVHDLRQDLDIVVLRDHVSAVTCMEWDNQGFFISTGRDAILNTWNIVKKNPSKTKNKDRPKQTYERIHTLPIYEQVEGMVVLPSTNAELIIATAGSKGIIRLWKATYTKNQISDFTLHANQSLTDSFGEAKGGYLKMTYNPRGSDEAFYGQGQLVVADAEHNILFISHSEATLTVQRTIVGHNDEILDMKIIPGTNHVAVATNSAQVRLFDLATFSCYILNGHTATVLCVDVSPCGRYLATCGKDKTMKLWDVTMKSCIAVATGHTEAIGATALSKKVGRYDVGGKAAKNGGGSFVVTASKDRTLKRWNLPGVAELKETVDQSAEFELRAFCSARAHEKDINIVSVAPNDSLVATGSQDKTVKLWKSIDLSLQGTLKGHKRGVWDCQFSPYDRVIATSSGDKTIKLWSLSDYSCVRTFQGHVSSALRVRFLTGGLQLVSSGADGLVKLWTIRTNECETTMDGHVNKVWALDMDGSTLVSGGADSQIVVWEDTTQQVEDETRATEEKSILLEQRLANHLRYNEYDQALDLALELHKPRQVLKVLSSIVEQDISKGLQNLQGHVKGWDMDRTKQVLLYCRDWNTRARNSHLAMLVVQAVVTTIPVSDLASADGIPEILAGIVPYSERHFDRLDSLYGSTYLLDFTLCHMGALDVDEDYELWEKRSKLVLPPKHLDGRIQKGGTPIVGGDSEGDDDDEVMTVGESESSDDETDMPVDETELGEPADHEEEEEEEDDDDSSSS